MNDFLAAIPWRLASLAALIVGIVSFAVAAADVWTALEHVGAAFVVFFLIGTIARAMLSAGGRRTDPAPAPHTPPRPMPGPRGEPAKTESAASEGMDSSEPGSP